MAYNVFGTPITTEVLRAMVEYDNKTITQKDRAHVALLMKNAEDKDKNVLEYVKVLKEQWGAGASTLCVIYNATGNTMEYICEHSWHGHIGPSPCPTFIQNGQWGGFLHVKTSGTATGSSVAVVHRVLNDDGESYDWMAAWSNPWSHLFSNTKAYTEIREKGHYTMNDYWSDIESFLDNSGLSHDDTKIGGKSIVTIGNDTSPIFQAIFTLDGA